MESQQERDQRDAEHHAYVQACKAREQAALAKAREYRAQERAALAKLEKSHAKQRGHSLWGQDTLPVSHARLAAAAALGILYGLAASAVILFLFSSYFT